MTTAEYRRITRVGSTRLRMTATLYAIRSKSTGLYLPPRTGKGFTNDEPTSPVPRLFWSLNGARSALGAWAKGRWVCKRTGGYSIADSFGYEYDEKINIVPVKGRDIADMEIVAFALKEQ